MTETKHETIKSIFIGEIHRKTYKCNVHPRYYGSYDRYPKVLEDTTHIDDERFYECDFEVPRLKSGEKLYINELDLTVEIKDSMRSTNGETIYHTNHVTKVVVNEDSEKELHEAQKTVDRHNKVIEESEEHYINQLVDEKVNNKLAEMKNNTWFQKLFGKGSIKL